MHFSSTKELEILKLFLFLFIFSGSGFFPGKSNIIFSLFNEINADLENPAFEF
jgi:hypothetical protein